MVKTNVEWDSMTTKDFAEFDAVWLPDDNCNNGVQGLSASSAKAWGLAISGPIVIIG